MVNDNFFNNNQKTFTFQAVLENKMGKFKLKLLPVSSPNRFIAEVVH